MTYFKVAEKFASINGEGQKAGQTAVFIRFAGCNLRCSYCDTAWAQNENAECEKLSAEQISQYIKSQGIKNVTLTGGEPLLQKGIEELISSLVGDGFWVEIETNGSVALSPLGEFRPHFTMDYKLPKSGEESKMRLENFSLLESGDVVKFVCSDKADLERTKEIIESYSLTEKCKVYISCVFGNLEPKEAVEFMLENRLNDVNFQLQMHKFIWNPDARGV